MPLSKEQIVEEIKRSAAANGGVPPGWRKFRTETGIGEKDWLGKHWARWSEALRDAGFENNQFNEPYSEDELLERYAKVTLDFGRLPTDRDIRFAVAKGARLPGGKTFAGKFGGKTRLIEKVREFCQSRPEYSQVVPLCEAYVPRDRDDAEASAGESGQIGFVYLMKSAKYYKIGKATLTARRHRELAIQMPERLILVHEIKTDDPFGIEAYWHNRFVERRRNGEWFELTAADVAAFKRRKFM
ncbi:MAG: GIY-YIG nuclease family protein [Phycisphaerales bacterium]